MASVVATLQDRLAFLLSCGAHASAEVLAQGLLIEAPATTATATAQSSPQVRRGEKRRDRVVVDGGRQNTARPCRLLSFCSRFLNPPLRLSTVRMRTVFP